MVELVYEPIPIRIGYRRRYGLSADISVLPISKMLIGIGYRYRPIWYLIWVLNEFALFQSYDKNLSRKYDINLSRKIWKKLLKMRLFSCTYNWIFEKPFMYSFSCSAWCAKKEELLTSYFLLVNSTYRYGLSVSADKNKNLSVFYRYRPIRKLKISVLIGIGR